MAGASPNTPPVRREISRANPSTTQSMLTSPSRGMFEGTKRRMKPKVPTAVTTPAKPPIKDSSMDSVSIWRTMRPRLAPSAKRTAISCCRPEARANSRLAMFNDTMKTIRMTAPSKTSSMGRTLPTKDSCNP